MTDTNNPTPSDIRDQLQALCAEIGPRADATVLLSSNYALSGQLSPEGILGKVTLHARQCHSWSDVVLALREKWEEYRDLHASNTTKGMALAIIRLTAELGECTDGALRCEFSQQDIDRYGDSATALATEMGGNGPFQIVRLGQGNYPDAEAA